MAKNTLYYPAYVIRRVVPALVNQFIIKLKDTSFLSGIAVENLCFKGKQFTQ
jgi:ABC-type amino acid transport system permease subunit